MPDIIENIGKSLIQHGTENDRVYLMKLDTAKAESTLDDVEELAAGKSYSKIFGKIPASVVTTFRERGYCTEASIPNFFNGNEDVHFMSRFLDPTRRCDVNAAQKEKVLKLALEKAIDTPKQVTLKPEWAHRICTENDVQQITAVYREVFESYPFPIHDPDYIRQTMDSHIVYFGIWNGKQLVALSSAEMDPVASNVEMTDFATLPDFRGNGFGLFLLQQMELEMRKRKIKTAYTIARSISAGMNIVFAKQGYQYGGTLVCNTDICGQLESMNIWYKDLAD